MLMNDITAQNKSSKVFNVMLASLFTLFETGNEMHWPKDFYDVYVARPLQFV